MKNILFILLLGFYLSAHAQFVAADLNSEAVTKSLSVFTHDQSGNLVITGKFYDTITIGGTTLTNSYPDNSNLYGMAMNGNDPFIAKRDSNGNYAWVKKITLNANPPKSGCTTSKSAAMINGICTDAGDNIFITGIFKGSINFDGFNIVSLTYKTGMCSDFSANIFTAKISPSGTVLWLKKEGSSSIYRESGSSIVADAAGNVVVTGTYYNKAVNGTSCPGGSWGGNGATAKTYFYVVKYNATGTKVWEKKFESNSYHCDKILEGMSVVTDGSNFYVAGMILGTATFGTISLSAGAINNTALIKLNASGNVVWATSFTGTDNLPMTLLLDDAGTDLFISGSFSAGNVDFGNGQSLTGSAFTNGYLAKCSTTDGSSQWAMATGNYMLPAGSIALRKTGHRMCFLPNGNIGIPLRVSSGSFMMNEYSYVTGGLVNSTVTTNAMAGTSINIPDIQGTSVGYDFLLQLIGGFEMGGTPILSEQPANLSLMLVQYSNPGGLRISGGAEHDYQLMCYPNPVPDILNLEDRAGLEIGEIRLIDPAGRIVYQEHFAESYAQINMQNLAPGMYILKRDNSDFRIIKEGAGSPTR